MKTKSTRKQVEHDIVMQIRSEMQYIPDPEIYQLDNFDFKSVKQVSSLISELLSNSDTKKAFEKAASASKVNGKNNEIWLECFEVIRNILVHFPWFNSWDEIYINRSLLNWNNNTGRQQHIEKFFDKYANKTLEYTIYYHNGIKWVPGHKSILKVPKLYAYKKLYLKDIISMKDYVMSFYIIDYYMSYMHFGLLNFSRGSI